MDLKTREETIAEYGIKELFQDSWFFGNLLQRSSSSRRPEKTICFSDPCSLEVLTGKSYEETYESIKKLSMGRDDESTRPVLVKAPSMPSSTERNEKGLLTRGSGLRRSKMSDKKKSWSNLVRAPSLPINLGDEDFEDEEIEFSMGRLIRQASMNCSDRFLPPRTHDTKAAATDSRLSRQRSRMKPEVESIVTDIVELDKLPQPPLKQLEPKSISTPLKPEKSQGFKEKNIKRSYHYYSEALKEGNISAQQVPLWGGGKRSSNDTKDQIKFWARAVASNVRQEC